MEENNRNDRNDERRTSEQDGPMTTREIIRDVNGDPDMNLNDLKEGGQGMSNNRESNTGNLQNTDTTQGMSWNPNDTSGVRSGGIADMDDQTAGGAGQNTGVRPGLGSNLTPKRGVTGSDFDGQDATSSSS
jgi:hypothetical protein